MSDLKRTIEILAQLVSFDTTSHLSNLPCVEWIENYLGQQGIACQRIVGKDNGKSNLWVTIGPTDQPGYILSGHMDTVPVNGQNWSFDPFHLTERDECLYGRGTADMKGFLAACLAMVPVMRQADLIRPIHLALSYDEEVGCIGVRDLLKFASRLEHKPLGCFVGEPSSMNTIIGHKGSVRYWIDVTGLSVHSSLVPLGVNAIENAARIIAKVHETERWMEQRGERDADYDIEHTTLQVGVMNGGRAPNIVPDSARFTFEVRAIGADDPNDVAADIIFWAQENVVSEMKNISEEAGVKFNKTSEIPGFDLPADSPFSILSQKLCGQVGTSKVSYGTEAGLYAKMLEIPVVVIGPGNIEQAHKPNEYISKSQLKLCLSFLNNLIELAAEPSFGAAK